MKSEIHQLFFCRLFCTYRHILHFVFFFLYYCLIFPTNPVIFFQYRSICCYFAVSNSQRKCKYKLQLLFKTTYYLQCILYRYKLWHYNILYSLWNIMYKRRIFNLFYVHIIVTGSFQNHILVCSQYICIWIMWKVISFRLHNSIFARDTNAKRSNTNI